MMGTAKDAIGVFEQIVRLVDCMGKGREDWNESWEKNAPRHCVSRRFLL